MRPAAWRGIFDVRPASQHACYVTPASSQSLSLFSCRPEKTAGRVRFVVCRPLFICVERGFWHTGDDVQRIQKPGEESCFTKLVHPFANGRTITITIIDQKRQKRSSKKHVRRHATARHTRPMPMHVLVCASVSS